MAQQISTNTFGVAKWVVSPDPTQGTHTTISAALAVASSGDTIWVRDGLYNENLTAVAGVNIVGGAFGSVSITGTLTASMTGSMTFDNVIIDGGASSAAIISGTNVTSLGFNNCLLASSGSAVCVGSSTVAYSFVFSGAQTQVLDNGGHGCLNLSGGAGAGAFNTFLLADQTNFFSASQATSPLNCSSSTPQYIFSRCGSSTVFQVSNSSRAFLNSHNFGADGLTNGINMFTVDSGSEASVYDSFVNGFFTINGALRTSELVFRTGSPATFALTGTGTVAYTLISLVQVSAIDPGLTLTPGVVRLGTYSTLTSVNAAASPYTILSTDDYLSVDSSGGPVTLLFPNTPNVGQTWVVKDATGSSLINNITITTVGGTDMIDGATSQAIMTNYGSTSMIGSSSTTYSLFT